MRPGSQALQDAVARNYFSVLAYKDEYEVARLHTESGFVESVKRNFGAGVRMSFHFSPPLFARLDPRHGAAEEVRARPMGAADPARAREAALAARHASSIRSARSADRRLERELLARYEPLLDRIAAELDDSRFDLALELARLPEQVRGYGPIKSAAAARARAAEQDLWEQWARAGRTRAAARASAA